ncbi:hypothetical protein Pcinc_000224 [Petrolisthes cinctipes]|uniref:Uncharacterized protein n=1 Tax=Petrolisthes cinctipes TaxID=88211 RepID=A0AAE1L501_PETCI|nr:hypothetical protein Pcinc_000224 [Petrolisthes cinctipes]
MLWSRAKGGGKIGAHSGGSPPGPVTLLELICLYGYSLSIFVPVSILWMIPQPWLQWCLAILAPVLSGGVLVRSIWPSLHPSNSTSKHVAIGLAALILLLHATLALGFMFYFFQPPPQSRSLLKSPEASTMKPHEALEAIGGTGKNIEEKIEKKFVGKLGETGDTGEKIGETGEKTGETGGKVGETGEKIGEKTGETGGKIGAPGGGNGGKIGGNGETVAADEVKREATEGNKAPNEAAGGNEAPNEAAGGNEAPNEAAGGNEAPNEAAGGNEAPNEAAGGKEGNEAPKEANEGAIAKREANGGLMKQNEAANESNEALNDSDDLIGRLDDVGEAYYGANAAHNEEYEKKVALIEHIMGILKPRKPGIKH